MEALVEQILALPQAYLLLQHIQCALHEEHKQRQHFYAVIDENTKMEFINGEIVCHSPVMMRHNTATKRLLYLIDLYVQSKDLGFVGVKKILISLTRNDYEPDICYFRKEKAESFTPKQTRFPAPDLAVEILSESTEEHDRITKFIDYAAHGVEEYWIVNPDEEYIEQYRLNPALERYELVMKSANGVLQSVVLAGFVMPVRAAFNDAENMQAIKQILTV